ncbi:MAG: hypothetical protein K2L48_00405 [Mycoplasmoidaceae bacterium]|nr:hypothetical protein [Mycoplasmoidaceae bacterium]
MTFKNIPRKNHHPIFSFKQKCQFFSFLLENENDVFLLDLKKKNMKAAAFVKYLKKEINPTRIIVGSDFKFGSDFKDVNFLSRYFDVDVVLRDDKYSTSKIREYISTGKIEEAQNDLITKIVLEGKVVKGKQLGRKLGYKTANFYRSRNLLKFFPGVYFAKASLPMDNYEKQYDSSMTIRNIEDGRQLIEVHLIGYDLPEFYGTNIVVKPLRYINQIRRPKSIDDLKKIIKNNFKKINKVTKN